MLIRHGEEADSSGGINLDGRGAPDDRGLNVRGWQRAGALVRYFAPLRDSGRESVVEPGSIIAMAATSDHPSSRPQLTVAPLAEELGQRTQLVANEHELFQALAKTTGAALVCWRHVGLPAVASALAPPLEAPKHWPESRYDLLWLLDFSSTPPRFRQLAQRLLPGDSPVLPDLERK